MTRARCALFLLLTLAWNVAAPWLGAGRAEAVRVTVIAGTPAPEHGATWLPSPAAGHQLARLAGHQAGLLALRAVVAARLPAPPSRQRGAPPPNVWPVHPRPHASRSADERDDPS